MRVCVLSVGGGGGKFRRVHVEKRREICTRCTWGKEGGGGVRGYDVGSWSLLICQVVLFVGPLFWP